MPVYDGVYAHERRPASIRGIKVFQVRAMRIRPPRADKDGFDWWVVGQVVFEGFAHGFGVAGEREVVCVLRHVYEFVDFEEWVRRDDVHRRQGLW